MKSIALTALTVLFLSVALKAQEISKVTLVKSVFHQNGKVIHHHDVLKMMENNQEAHTQMKSALSSRGFATVLSFAGGFMIGWPIGTALGGGDPNWALAGIGGGLVILSIPVINSFEKKANSALDTYYDNSPTSMRRYRPSLHFASTSNGIGFILKI